MERTFYIPKNNMTEEEFKEFCQELPWLSNEGKAVITEEGHERILNEDDPLLDESVLEEIGGYEVKTVSMFSTTPTVLIIS